MTFRTRVLPNTAGGGFGLSAYLLDAPPDLAFGIKEGVYYGEIKKGKKEVFHGLFYYGAIPTLGVKDKHLELLVIDLGGSYIGIDEILECTLKQYLHEVRTYDLVEYLVRDTEIDKQTVITKYLYA